MATTTKQTPTAQGKKAATEARATAEQATAAARVAAEETQRNVRTLVRDSAFATLGVGDLAIGVVRNLGEKAAELRTEAPSAIRTGADPRQISTRLERTLTQVRTDAGTEFQRLSQRGRSLVEQVQRSSSTRRAAEQVGNARSQVKAATTSVSRAARLLGGAAGETVSRVGDEGVVDYDAKTLEELREMARVRDISGRSSMNRDELVEALRQA